MLYRKPGLRKEGVRWSKIDRQTGIGTGLARRAYLREGGRGTVDHATDTQLTGEVEIKVPRPCAEDGVRVVCLNLQ